MRQTHMRRPGRRAMTLVELLVVVTIMMALAALVLPRLQLNGGARRTREAARMIDVFFGAARSRAVETGRPCGVMFQRLENQSTGAATLFQVEVPPLYAGDVMDARVILQYVPGTPPALDTILIQEVTVGSILNTLVRVGDKIQFNGQGPWYTVFGLDIDNNGILDPPTTMGDPQQIIVQVEPEYVGHVPWNQYQANPSPPVSFQIQRQPTQTFTPPMALPTGVVVDLGASGVADEVQRFESGTGPVTVLFSPNGAVSACYWNEVDPASGVSGSYCEVPTEPLFFLVGRREQLGVGRVIFNPDETVRPATRADADPATMANWQIMTNYWVTLNPQTGMAGVSENAVAQAQWYDKCAGDGNYATNDDDAVRQRRIRAAVDEARSFAKQSRSMGGR